MEGGGVDYATIGVAVLQAFWSGGGTLYLYADGDLAMRTPISNNGSYAGSTVVPVFPGGRPTELIAVYISYDQKTSVTATAYVNENEIIY